MNWRDLTAIEDALSDAFVAALESWPITGVPNKPEAWLLTAARRRLIDGARRAQVHAAAVSQLIAMVDEGQETDIDGYFPDERLKLLFICAHPAIDPAIHAPLMLQTVLGLDRLGWVCLLDVLPPWPRHTDLNRDTAF